MSLVIEDGSFIGNFEFKNSYESSEFIVRNYFGNLVFQDDLKNTNFLNIYSVLSASEIDLGFFESDKINFLDFLLAIPSGANQEQLIFNDKGLLFEIKYPDLTRWIVQTRIVSSKT